MNVVQGCEPALLYVAEYTTNQSEDERDWHLGERSATLPESFIGVETGATVVLLFST